MKIALHAANDIITPPNNQLLFLSLLIEMIIATTNKKIRETKNRKTCNILLSILTLNIFINKLSHF